MCKNSILRVRSKRGGAHHRESGGPQRAQYPDGSGKKPRVVAGRGMSMSKH